MAKRVVAMVALALAMSIPLFGAGQSDAEPAESVDLVFMGWGQPAEQEIFQQMIDKFVEANPASDVEYLNVDPAQFGSKLNTMITAGNAPDVFYVPETNFVTYVRAHVLANLDPYLESASEIFEKDNVWPQAWARWSYDGQSTGHGSVYALPKDLGPYPMVYNKDLLDAHGIEYPSPTEPWTWEQFLDAAGKITEDTDGDGEIDIFGVAFIPAEAAVWSHGGDWLSEDRTKVTINTPEFIEGMSLVVDITNKYHYAPDIEDSAAAGWWVRWVRGEVAFSGMGPWDQPTFWKELDFDWDIAQWPMASDTGISQNWLGSMGIGVSEDSDAKQAAFDLAAFLTLDEDGQRAIYQLGQAVPNLIDMAYGEFSEYDRKPENRRVFIEYIEKWSRPPAQVGMVDIRWWDTFWQNWSQVTQEGMSVADWVAEQQPILQQLYEEGGNLPE